MKLKKLYVPFLFLLSCMVTWAQDNPPVVISQGTYMGETIPLRDAPLMTTFEGSMDDLTFVDMRRLDNGENTVDSSQDGSPDGFDGAKQTQTPKFDVENLVQNFDGIDISQSGGAGVPDPTGAVGPDHYITAVNISIRIFDKEGTSLVGPINLSGFLGLSGQGDPIVMYDQLADRYFVSQFRTVNNSVTIGVSTTADPTGTYHVYNYPLGQFPDYPHYAVWPNAYFLTANKGGQTTYAFDRETMLRGGEDPALVGFSLGGVRPNSNTVFAPQTANLLGRVAPVDAPGYIVYFQDDSWPNVTGIDFDHLKVWSVDVDFNGTSSISDAQIIPVADFDSFIAPFGSGDFEQPGTNQRIDGITGVMSYMANYRSYEDFNSILVNFNVEVDGVGGIRWIELRNEDNGPFSVFQEGTYTLPDDVNRFMGSMSIDKDGNFGLGYNVSSSTVFPGMRYAGRLVDDSELGTINVAETTIIDGLGGVGTFNRFGDYAQMTMDIDNRTFWYTAEYMGAQNAFWRTRIASFTLGDREADDVAVYGFEAPLYQGPFTNSETFTALVANFGTNDQSNFEVELRVNGSLITTDTYNGTLLAGEYGTHVFTVNVDMSAEGEIYNVAGKTILAIDSYADNDEFNYNYFNPEVLGTDSFAALENDLLIYPVDGKIYEINLSTKVSHENVTYRMFDISGKQIGTGQLVFDGIGYKTKLNMSSFPSGVYIAEVSDGTDKVSKKILVR
jgi:hypothetical protein